MIKTKINKHRKNQRIIFIILTILCCVAALAFIVSSFRDNIVFFYSPSELHQAKIADHKIIRVGGLIKKGSVHNLPDSVIEFTITDYKKDLPIYYRGIRPNLFREGQGAVAKGFFDATSSVFIASELLTKHDEKYMPPEVAKSLKKK